MQPGSPCNDFKGYCDVFKKCRLVDADGPLARLKKAIFNPELYKGIAQWIVASVSLILKYSFCAFVCGFNQAFGYKEIIKCDMDIVSLVA